MDNILPIPYPGVLTPDEFKTLPQGTLLALASRAIGDYATREIHNPGHLGLQLVVAAEDVGTSGTLDVVIEVLDPATGAWGAYTSEPDEAWPQISATGVYVFTTYPGQIGADNSGVRVPATRSLVLPARFRVKATVGTDAVEFSVCGFLLP